MNRTPEHCGCLAEYLEGRMDGEARELFERHVEGCGECLEQTASWQEIKREYVKWVADRMEIPCEVPSATAASAFATAVIEKLEEQKVRPLPRRQPVLYIAAAAAVVIALVGVVRFIDRNSISKTDEPVAERQVPASETAQPLPIYIPIVQIEAGVVSKFVLEASPGTQIVAPKNGRVLAAVFEDKLGVDASGTLTLTSAGPKETVLRLNSGVVACLAVHREDGLFKVMAGNVSVEVIGTRFSVSLREDGAVTVVVADGSVRVSEGDEKVLLEAGQALVAAEGGFSAVMTADEENLSALSRLLSEETAAIESSIDAGSLGASNTEGPRSAIVRNHPNLKTNAIRRDDEAWRALIIAGKTAEALEQITAYLKSAPADADARMLLAVCQKKLHRYQDAVDSYTRVFETADAGLRNRARYLAGELCQSNLGDDEAAVGFFDAYLNNSPVGAPNRAEAKLRLAESLLKLGNTDRAERVLAQIISEYGRTPIANRARLLMEQHHEK